MILVYAFSNQWGTNIARRTLSQLKDKLNSPDIVFLPVYFHPRQFFKKYIEHNIYSLVIGLGDGPRYLNRINIETQAKNAYHDQTIYPFSPIFLDLSLPNVDIYDSNHFKISSNMGTYNCNWLAYSTELSLNRRHLSTHHLFFHLPPKSPADFLASNIYRILAENKLIG